MADIRAAFEEVRATLNLGADTVLFGVPVDADDALAQNTTTQIAPATAPVQTVTAAEIVTTDAPTDTAPAVSDTPATPAADTVDVPVKKKKSSTRRASARATATPATETTPTDVDSGETAQTDTVVPILSVLAAQTASVENDDTQPVISDVTDIPTESDAITEMITDDAPEVTREKTLEELLESMTPLREDTHEDAARAIADPTPATTEVEISDADATLEQLASEFAQNEDKIVTTIKNETHGKIGKLKNILPFKKAKRDDTGIMGDLFGWAGIAANDEDFAIPGFFTTTAAKK